MPGLMACVGFHGRQQQGAGEGLEGRVEHERLVLSWDRVPRYTKPFRGGEEQLLVTGVGQAEAAADDFD